MKARQDFVTNSSSSSFILGFQSNEEIDETMRKQLPYYWSEYVIDDIISDVKNGITTKDNALEIYRDALWIKYDTPFHGKDYFDLTKEERNSQEYKNFIQQKEDELVKNLKDKLDEYNIISVVEYEDHSLLGSELEHDIMPYLQNTAVRMSHH